MVVLFFFFKQKTAYEMRISDWSSDVCSSDLAFILGCRALGMRDLGPQMAPMNAFLTLTGMETLHLRMERHCANALALAEWLQKHPKVEWVSYAGLPCDRYHALAQRSLGGKGGAVFTFGLKGGYAAGEIGRAHV